MFNVIIWFSVRFIWTSWMKLFSKLNKTLFSRCRLEESWKPSLPIILLCFDGLFPFGKMKTFGDPHALTQRIQWNAHAHVIMLSVLPFFQFFFSSPYLFHTVFGFIVRCTDCYYVVCAWCALRTHKNSIASAADDSKKNYNKYKWRWRQSLMAINSNRLKN